MTPSLNQAQFIEETIESVLGQDYSPIEYIVVDGGSNDGTLEILRRYPQVRWISESDEGQADALNKGFRMAGGGIFGWLNADDVYLPGAIRSVVDVFRTTSSAFVYGGLRILREDGEVAFDIPARDWNYDELLEVRNFVGQPAAFFTRVAFEAVGGLDRRYHYALDYDLWLRMGKRFPGRPIDRIVAGFRFHDESKSIAAVDRFFPEAHKASRRAGGRYFSPMYRYRLPQRHPSLFKVLIAMRLIRRRDMQALVSALRRLARGSGVPSGRG